VNRDPEKVFKANAKMRVMADKAPAEFLMSSLEYRAVFREPIFSAFETRTEIVKVLYDAFREWNVTFEDITLRSVVMTANDLQVGCDLLSKRVTFTVMLNSCTLVVTNPNWSEAPLIQQLVERGLGAVHAIGGAVWNQTVTLAMHIRGAGQSRLERTARFRPSLTGGPPTKKELGFAFCVYADDISWLIDLSAVYSDALFVKIVRSFEASITFDQIGATLYNDEREVLDLVELTLV